MELDDAKDAGSAIKPVYLIILLAAIGIFALYSHIHNELIAIACGLGIAYLILARAEESMEWEPRKLYENAQRLPFGANKLSLWNQIKDSLQTEAYGDIRMYTYTNPNTTRRDSTLIWMRLDRNKNARIDSVYNANTNPGMGVAEVRDIAIKKGYRKEESLSFDSARKIIERAGYEIVRKSTKNEERK